MKGHWIPPSPKGFIDQIAAKLGYSKTIPSGLGTDLVDAVGTLNDQIANKLNKLTVVDNFTTTTIPATTGNNDIHSFALTSGKTYAVTANTYGHTTGTTRLVALVRTTTTELMRFMDNNINNNYYAGSTTIFVIPTVNTTITLTLYVGDPTVITENRCSMVICEM